MAPPQKFGASFSPEQIKALGDAFDMAVRAASAKGAPFAATPTRELRRQLAGLVLAETRNGPINAARIASRALDSLRVLVGGADLIGRQWSKPQLRHVKTTAA